MWTSGKLTWLAGFLSSCRFLDSPHFVENKELILQKGWKKFPLTTLDGKTSPPCSIFQQRSILGALNLTMIVISSLFHRKVLIKKTVRSFHYLIFFGMGWTGLNLKHWDDENRLLFLSKVIFWYLQIGRSTCTWCTFFSAARWLSICATSRIESAMSWGCSWMMMTMTMMMITLLLSWLYHHHSDDNHHHY